MEAFNAFFLAPLCVQSSLFYSSHVYFLRHYIFEYAVVYYLMRTRQKGNRSFASQLVVNGVRRTGCRQGEASPNGHLYQISLTSVPFFNSEGLVIHEKKLAETVLVLPAKGWSYLGCLRMHTSHVVSTRVGRVGWFNRVGSWGPPFSATHLNLLSGTNTNHHNLNHYLLLPVHNHPSHQHL